MDTFFTRQLVFSLCLFCLLSLVSTHADASSNASYDKASADCQASLASFYTGTAQTHNKSCTDKPPQDGNAGYFLQTDHYTQPDGSSGVVYGSGFTYSGVADPPAACAGIAPTSGAYSGRISSGSPMCQGDSGSPGCMMTFTPDSPSFPLNGGGFGTHGSYKPTGASCTPGAVTPQNPPVTVPAVLCGGGSCYDSSSGKACASSADGQVCVQVPKSTPSSGACSVSGSSAICAGSPNAPLPPAANVPDPPSEAKTADNYPLVDPNTSFPVPVNVTTYSGSGSITNGATPGAASTPGSGFSGSTPSSSSTSAPASSSSSGTGDKDKASGGTDCNSPPICSGNAISCAIDFQTFSTRCETKKIADGLDATKLTADPEIDGNTDLAGYTLPTNELGGTSSGTGLDASGYGMSATCPLTPIVVTLLGQTMTIDYTKLCDYLSYRAALVMIMAYLAAAKIIMG